MKRNHDELLKWWSEALYDLFRREYDTAQFPDDFADAYETCLRMYSQYQYALLQALSRATDSTWPPELPGEETEAEAPKETEPGPPKPLRTLPYGQILHEAFVNRARQVPAPHWDELTEADRKDMDGAANDLIETFCTWQRKAARQGEDV